MKKILKKIGDWISNLFHSISPKIQKAVSIAINVTNAIKNFDLKNPSVADILTTIIPGDVDDNVKNILRAELPKIVVELKLVDSTLNLKDPNEIMEAALKVLQQLDKDYSSAFLHSMATLIAQVVADGKLDWKDAVYIVQYFYEETKKK